jgi:uncharacterized protein YjbI with pentapeptide repeats
MDCRFYYKYKKFVKKDLSLEESVSYGNCEFVECRLYNKKLNNCEFKNCKFLNCDFSNSELNNISFEFCEFENCKLIGIDFSKCLGNYKMNTFLVYFNECDLSFSNFSHLKIKNAKFTHCKLISTNFFECDFYKGSFHGSNLKDTTFFKVNLSYVDFRESINYFIDPDSNNIKKAKFSFPNVLNLLKKYDIDIE